MCAGWHTSLHVQEWVLCAGERAFTGEVVMCRQACRSRSGCFVLASDAELGALVLPEGRRVCQLEAVTCLCKQCDSVGAHSVHMWLLTCVPKWVPT